MDTRREMYVREIARTSDLALRTVQRELAVLRKIGVVTSRTNGYHLFFRANRDHRAVEGVSRRDPNKRMNNEMKTKPTQVT